MDITENLICPCNGKHYVSQSSLKTHRKTQCHQFWEQTKYQKEINIQINRLENENGHLKRLNFVLMERITDLEKKAIN